MCSPETTCFFWVIFNSISRRGIWALTSAASAHLSPFCYRYYLCYINLRMSHMSLVALYLPISNGIHMNKSSTFTDAGLPFELQYRWAPLTWCGYYNAWYACTLQIPKVFVKYRRHRIIVTANCWFAVLLTFMIFSLYLVVLLYCLCYVCVIRCSYRYYVCLNTYWLQSSPSALIFHFASYRKTGQNG